MSGLRERLLLVALAALAGLPAAGAPAARPKVCLVLSGGGARGIAHIGVLRVLEELRIPVDCIVGTSAGAIIGGAYASGASPAEIERMIGGADWDHLLTDQPARINRSVYTKEIERTGIGGTEVGLRDGSISLPRGVLIGQQLQFYLQSLVSPATDGAFDALPVQYRALATDFENGHLVVLDHGDLAAAIRASMSIPGAFAPVDYGGTLLVDGGLVRNLGVDVARSLGADVVIAVNVGTPLRKRAELGSLLSAAEQTLNILVEQNVTESIASLRPGDVLITPALGDFYSGDFAHGVTLIPAGERATRAAAAALAPLALEPAAYAAWLKTQRRARVAPHYDHVRVDTSRLRLVPPASIERLLGGATDAANPDTTINTLLGTDDFERVEGEVQPGPDGTTLVLRPIEKPWGPDYLRAGARLSASADGLSAFTLIVDERHTWLAGDGLEWRNRASLGQVDALTSALRLPLDAARLVFVSPYVAATDTLREIYVGDNQLETYRLRSFRGGLDLGVRFGNLGEFTAGFESGPTGAARTVGAQVVPDVHHKISDFHARWVLDGLDDLDFPRQGFLVSGEAELARHVLGSDDSYNRLTVEGEKAYGTEHSSLLMSLRFDSALGSTLPYYEQFSLGGFQNLSGLLPDQIVATRATLARLIYRHEIGAFSRLLPGVYAGVSLEAADLGPRPAGVPAGQVYAGSVFLSAASALGPLYLGLGVADGGFVSVYLLVGRP
jgi:NTE family protein